MAHPGQPASPDAGPDDTQIPELPSGWIAQWDARFVLILCPAHVVVQGHKECSPSPWAVPASIISFKSAPAYRHGKDQFPRLPWGHHQRATHRRTMHLHILAQLQTRLLRVAAKEAVLYEDLMARLHMLRTDKLEIEVLVYVRAALLHVRYLMSRLTETGSRHEHAHGKKWETEPSIRSRRARAVIPRRKFTRWIQLSL